MIRSSADNPHRRGITELVAGLRSDETLVDAGAVVALLQPR
jgi:hypothetical protein